MEIVGFDLFKKHVRVDDLDDDDDKLRLALDAATAAVVRYTNRTVEELVDMGSGGFPPELRSAIVMWGAHLYKEGEGVSGVSMHEIPYTISALLKPFVKLV